MLGASIESLKTLRCSVSFQITESCKSKTWFNTTSWASKSYPVKRSTAPQPPKCSRPATSTNTVSSPRASRPKSPQIRRIPAKKWNNTASYRILLTKCSSIIIAKSWGENHKWPIECLICCRKRIILSLGKLIQTCWRWALRIRFTICLIID